MDLNLMANGGQLRRHEVSYGMPNRLAGATSPYLLQHAGNPIDWYPWGDEALAAARDLDRPILLSIGYAACHWCHVMAHESFEDADIAAVMNEHFVCIKVDREERPDLDAVYMQAVQAMTGHGGWPMTVFLTPAGEPFYGGTYFPPADRHGMPSFRRVLDAVYDAFINRPETIRASARSMQEIYDAAAPDAAVAAPIEVNDAILTAAARTIMSRYDANDGGFGGAPKFPPTMLLDFLLRHWARTGDSNALDVAHATFVKMSRGGIFDQLGGGFARYSVDAQWLVPHFEKMLYDNALLIRFGAHLFAATHDDDVRRATEHTMQWLTREMTAPEGGFYSSLDADSEGVEGKFYIWRADELDDRLGSDAALVRAYFGVTESGNFDGANILHVPAPPDIVARNFGLSVAEVTATVDRAREVLHARRERRVRPGRDDKIIAEWNGLALRAVVEAAQAFDHDDYRTIATRNAVFLRDRMIADGRVVRSFRNGVAGAPGFLADQAAVALGFLAMFEQSLDATWLESARDLAHVMLDEFYDESTGTFYDSARTAERLVTRPHDPSDNATPSGTSLAVDLLLRLSNYGDNQQLRDLAMRTITSLASRLERFPSASGHMLGNVEYAETFACHGDYCDMPGPKALDVARGITISPSI
jgi:uncharacterized protein YyaL (SSP411 family)